MSAESTTPATPLAAAKFGVWNDAAAIKPPAGKKVIVCGHWQSGNRWRTTATWQPAGTLDASSWDEAPDDWWDADGRICVNPIDAWFEEQAEGDNLFILDEVTHWMLLPDMPGIIGESEDRARLEREATYHRNDLASMIRIVFPECDHADALAEPTSWQAEQVRSHLYQQRDALAHAQREADALRSQLTAATQALAGLEAANAELRRGLDMVTEEGARCAARCRYRNGIIRWLVEQLRGDSGAGESHWEQFPAYRAACVEINSDTTPNET